MLQSYTAPQFWRHHANLPQPVKAHAKRRYALFMTNPNHPSLKFKAIRRLPHVYSVRISDDYRALGVRKRNEITWFWIGSHTDYTALIKRLR
ncbi:MAG: hypothetical protein OXU88_05615 [Gammaproteobacteria bacterium]|nr:hypothetical protein [Gammaproteobacteria bacterium]